MPNQPLQLPTVSTEEGRLEHLVVVRESPQYDYLLMEGMIGQTIGRLLHLPGAGEVLAAGISPLRGTSPFRTFQYRKHRTTAVMFEHHGILYLYSLGSAAAANINDQENAFVELLVDVIEHYRPVNLHVATFSRLVRSTEFAGRLQRAVKAHVDVIQYGDQQLKPKSPEGKIMWSMLALMADMERDLIVQRLFAGTCNAYLRGHWILSEEAVPPGYELDPQTRIVRPDPTLVEPVRTFLTMMADPKMTSRQVLDEAGALGLSSATTRRIHGPDATFADVIRADSKLAGMVDWIDTYLTGQVTIPYSNPFPGATSFGSLKVEGADKIHPGHVRFTYDWGLPDGGWAPTEVLEAARKRCRGTKERRATGGSAHYRRKPFAGWTAWQDDTHHYHLSGTSRHYVLLRQRLTDNIDEGVMPRLSTDHGRTADRVASIDPLELHAEICTSAVGALRAGAPLECLDGLEYFHLRSAGFGVRNTTEQRREQLTALIQRQRHIAEQARFNANTSTSSRLRTDFLADAENALMELEALERQLDDLEEERRPGVVPEQFDAEIDFIAHALAQLAVTHTTPSAEFGQAINQVVTDLRIVPAATGRTCEVKFHLLLPADGMVLRFGPICASVINRAYASTLPDDVRPDAPRLLLTRMATAHQLAGPRADSDHEVLQKVKLALVAHGYTDLAAGTIVRSDFGPLYEIAANDLWGEPLTGDYDPRYVELVRSLYRSPDFRWNPRHHSLDCTLRQQLVDAVAGRGGTAAYPDVIADLVGTGVDDQRIAIYGRAQQLGEAPPWEPCVERLGKWVQYAPRAERSLRLWACPHCGGHASKVVRVPEVAACLLCPDCRRMPTADSPVFPAVYLDV